VAAPAVPRALLTHARQMRAADVVRDLLRGPLTRLVPAVHLEQAQATGEAVARYRSRGLRVGVWTVNDPAAAASLAVLGVGSIITDAPGAVVAALYRGPFTARM
ncbi:MAG: glycerophosphodiester phosphodiesterase, partial [Polyangiaceae bacterium]|nr:glycerophosphodiester phosphodiesterase [Polyangiaceae bacterium]